MFRLFSILYVPVVLVMNVIAIYPLINAGCIEYHGMSTFFTFIVQSYIAVLNTLMAATILINVMFEPHNRNLKLALIFTFPYQPITQLFAYHIPQLICKASSTNLVSYVFLVLAVFLIISQPLFFAIFIIRYFKQKDKQLENTN